jgi:hypothetical protein
MIVEVSTGATAVDRARSEGVDPRGFYATLVAVYSVTPG